MYNIEGLLDVVEHYSALYSLAPVSFRKLGLVYTPAGRISVEQAKNLRVYKVELLKAGSYDLPYRLVIKPNGESELYYANTDVGALTYRARQQYLRAYKLLVGLGGSTLVGHSSVVHKEYSTFKEWQRGLDVTSLPQSSMVQGVAVSISWASTPKYGHGLVVVVGGSLVHVVQDTELGIIKGIVSTVTGYRPGSYKLRSYPVGSQEEILRLSKEVQHKALTGNVLGTVAPIWGVTRVQ